MSDHVDGPRSIGEPTADVTDLFAFTSPENPGRIVLAMCVFPYAGENAIFSNVIDYSIAVRRDERSRHRQRRKVSTRGRRDPLQLSVRDPQARRCGESDPARRLQIAGRSRIAAHGERGDW